MLTSITTTTTPTTTTPTTPTCTTTCTTATATAPAPASASTSARLISKEYKQRDCPWNRGCGASALSARQGLRLEFHKRKFVLLDYGDMLCLTIMVLQLHHACCHEFPMQGHTTSKVHINASICSRHGKAGTPRLRIMRARDLHGAGWWVEGWNS